jgi:hypothetical protein
MSRVCTRPISDGDFRFDCCLKVPIRLLAKDRHRSAGVTGMDRAAENLVRLDA